MPEIYIIRPTEHAAHERGVPLAEAIIENGMAEGFVGKLDRVKACQTIIIINDQGANKAATVSSVERVEPMDGQSMPRVTVTFHSSRHLSHAEQRMCAAITWSSSNIRYRTLP